MEAIEFEKKTGFAPEQDDLQRANCTLAGEIGHNSCGWCAEHDKPRFSCGCTITTKESAHDPHTR